MKQEKFTFTIQTFQKDKLAELDTHYIRKQNYRHNVQ